MLKFIQEKNRDNWEHKCMCNSNYAADKDNRLSVLGYCIYVNRCLVLWKSRAQRSHTISSTEVEICMEILFVQMIMEFLGQTVEYPIKVYCDNMSWVQQKISRRTQHINMSTHFI